MFPRQTLCRQCEDTRRAPTFARMAPSAVTKRFVHVMQKRCIGCKTCVCPYGAMEAVVRPVVRRNSGAGLNVRAESRSQQVRSVSPP